ncbi:MAG: tetratricopeptide repeat protein [Pseudomonadales bacterium]
MSLLLDALKQAEQNKKKNTEAEPAETVSAQHDSSMPQAQAAEPLAVIEDRIEDQPPAPASETRPASGPEQASEPATRATEGLTTPPPTVSTSTQKTRQTAKPEQNTPPDTSPAATALNPALNVFAAGNNRPSKSSKHPRMFALLLLLALVILGLASAYFWLSTQQSKPVYADTPYFDEEIPGDETTATTLPAQVAEPQHTPGQLQLPAESQPLETAKRPPQAVAATVENEARPAIGNEAQPDTGNAELVITRKRPIEIKKRTMTQQQSERLTQAYRALLAGEYDQARSLYQHILSESPKQLDAMLGLAKIYSQENQPQAARQLYEKVLRVDESNSVAQLGLLHTYQGQTAFEKTVVLQELSDKYPENGQIAASLGDELARQSKWPVAQQAYFKAFSLNPGSALYAYNLAVSLDRMEKYGAARQYYLKALELNANDAGTLNIDVINQRLLQLGE